MGPAGDIEARVRALASDVVARAGYELVDVEYRREPGGWTLRLFIDKEGGVSLDDCQRVSREVGTLLDVEDPIPSRFNLEVSSPGLDRPLRREKDFLAALGRLVKVATREPLDGRRHFSGRLRTAGPEPGPQGAEEAGQGAFVLRIVDDAGGEHRVPLSAVDKAKIVYEWPEPKAGKPGKGRRAGSGEGRPEGKAGTTR